jgi:uncharacterized protein
MSSVCTQEPSNNSMQRTVLPAAADAVRQATSGFIAACYAKEPSMSRQIFLNLPVADLAKSKAFFKALGFSNNPQMSGDDGACMVISDTILVMLCTQKKFRDFTPKAICDTSKAVEMLINLSCESREEVDALVARALAAGGSTYDTPQDLGFMYSHSFIDLDGHGWGLFHAGAMPGQE